MNVIFGVGAFYFVCLLWFYHRGNVEWAVGCSFAAGALFMLAFSMWSQDANARSADVPEQCP